MQLVTLFLTPLAPNICLESLNGRRTGALPDVSYNFSGPTASHLDVPSSYLMASAAGLVTRSVMGFSRQSYGPRLVASLTLGK